MKIYSTKVKGIYFDVFEKEHCEYVSINGFELPLESLYDFLVSYEEYCENELIKDYIKRTRKFKKSLKDLQL